VYYHKATRSAEKIFTELLVRAIALIRDGCAASAGIPENHPIMRFAKEPTKVENVLLLDDAVIWGALSMMAAVRQIRRNRRNPQRSPKPVARFTSTCQEVVSRFQISATGSKAGEDLASDGRPEVVDIAAVQLLVAGGE
jgi:hypothetical protein